MKKCAIFFMISFMLCLPLSLKGSDSPGQTDESPTDTEEHKKVGFAVIPVAFYQPETKFGGGVVGLFSIRPDPLVKTGRPSTVSLLVIYTQLNQFNFHIQPEIYLKDESFLLKGEFNTKRFSYKFWGIGNESPDEAEEDFTPRTTVLKLSLQKEILPSENLYAGIQYQMEDYTIVEKERGGILDSGSVQGSLGNRISGWGLILNWDTRDNIHYPTRGNLWELSSLFNRKSLGSDLDFTSLVLDLRTYRPLFGTHVLAFQGLFQTVSGTPPFRHYPKMGGSNIMRGYYIGRYRDKNLAAVQAEYRLPVVWRFGIVGFAGLGGVSDRMGGFRWKDFRYSFGVGLRFKIFPSEGTNLRVDFAFGENSSGIYFTALESF
jgi:outer membrane protein assembly factor BamA